MNFADQGPSAGQDENSSNNKNSNKGQMQTMQII